MIKAIRKKYYSNSIHTNLFTISLLLFLIVMVPTMLFTNYYNNHKNRIQFQSMATSNLDLSYKAMVPVLEGASKVSFSVLGNTTVQNALSTAWTSPQREVAVEDILYNLCSASPFRLSAYLYDFSGHHYSSEYSNRKHLLYTDITSLPCYQKVWDAEGKPMVFNAKEIYNNTEGLSVVRIIKDLNTLEDKGLLVVNIEMENLINVFTDDKVLHSQGFILDAQENNILGEDITQAADYIQKSTAEKETIILGGKKEKQILSFRILPEWNLVIGSVGQMPQTGMMEAIPGIVLTLFLSVTMIWIGILFVSHSLAKPITTLANKMSSFAPGAYSEIETRFSESNEIGRLAKCYNEMAKEISDLMKQEIAAEKHRKHLELNLLQNQFKPHFLYNTLDHARVLVLSGDTQNAGRLLQAMGIYYKTILSKGRTTISISDEVNTIHQYIKILSFAGELGYEMEYEIDESVKNLEILKFILQPLVENSIKHGVYGLDDGIIRIAFHLLEDDTLVIRVSDNGRGMQEEQKQELLEASFHSSSKSFGLAATLERLRLFYGEACKINIFDNDPGLKIEIKISEFTKNEKGES